MWRGVAALPALDVFGACGLAALDAAACRWGGCGEARVAPRPVPPCVARDCGRATHAGYGAGAADAGLLRVDFVAVGADPQHDYCVCEVVQENVVAAASAISACASLGHNFL
jgi:hypothetical protein